MRHPLKPAPTSAFRPATGLATALVAAALLSGCIVVPGGRHQGGGYGGGVYAGEVVTVAPPAPQVEVIGVAPGPGFFWVSGYWNWIGSRHVWVGGRWEAHRPGYAWQPHTWQRDGGGWRMRQGYWARR